MALGIAFGWNPERAHKPAGLRTHLLVSLGSAIMMLISLEMYYLYNSATTSVDPGRIAAQVVSGIGFIGAGTIMHADGGLVKGLTTAASIWAVSGVGMACGAGMYMLAVAGTVVTLISLALVNRIIMSNGSGASEGKQKKD
ncbi:MAG: MgtC/SapB family protein [Candidatus Firestonebacteria bacterium]|nr:MgtC/SapB family protein [Candidatus Firestonebacteria bacterium]